MEPHQDRSQDKAKPIAVGSSTTTPPRILVDSTLPASQAASATSSSQSRGSPAYMIPSSSASEIASQEAFPSSITLDEIPSLAQSSLLKSERENKAQHQFTLKVQQHARVGLALGDERSSAKSSRIPPLDPPIICELIAHTQAGASLFGILELALRATLVDGMSPERVIGTTTAGLRPLHGDVDQSAFIAPIFSRTEQSLFIFSELCVRPAGDFRIRLDLVDRSGMTFINLGCVYTERFVVVGDKSSYPGLSPSSDLMQAIVRRGLKLRLTKSSKEEAPTSQSKSKKKASAASTKRRVESPGPSSTEWAGTSRAHPLEPYPTERPRTAEIEALNRHESLRTFNRSPADISGSSSPQHSSSRSSPRPGIISRASAPGRSSPLPPEPTPHVLRSAASLPRLPASSARSDPIRPWEQPGTYLPPLRLSGSEEQYHPSRLSAQLPPLQSLPRTSSMRLPAMGPPALPSLYQPQQQQQQQHLQPHQPRYHSQLPQQSSYQQYHQPQQQYPQPQSHQHQHQHQYQHQFQQQRQSHDPYDQDIIMGPPPIPTASNSSSSASSSSASASATVSQEDYPSNRLRLPSIQHVLNVTGDPGPRPSSRERRPPSAGAGPGTGAGDVGSGAPSMEGSAEEGLRRGHGGRQAGERWPWEQGYRQ
ncbi:hypothetical protein BCV69DRAFT_112266 [Microstroma glucosiphilum]|uniref:Velvet domain-containing protein n=1 Tax=Pseudomicrostroma glucosiphilum TaxID=1684307 RepID=A0A316UEB5_9BASI|nr:hypothetical protein BCV69DRAFT_112266 [Pseudomicrostroma glucosiphilum]PWN23224.1 hypothetical protein BCV69DRAFT_112266 [Pseudomicrostroma glucosiphilum]